MKECAQNHWGNAPLPSENCRLLFIPSPRARWGMNNLTTEEEEQQNICLSSASPFCTAELPRRVRKPTVIAWTSCRHHVPPACTGSVQLISLRTGWFWLSLKKCLTFRVKKLWIVKPCPNLWVVTAIPSSQHRKVVLAFRVWIKQLLLFSSLWVPISCISSIPFPCVKLSQLIPARSCRKFSTTAPLQ